MPYGLYISAEGAQAQTRRLDVIANNIANVDTVGFKRDLAVMQSRYSEAIERGMASPGEAAQSDIGGGVQFQESVTDFSQGPLRRTGNPTDAALQGDGFFVVRKGQERMLTRAGNFRLKPTGELVTQQGYPVLSEDNTPITINPDGGRWDIGAYGQCHSGEHVAAAANRPAGLARRPQQGRRKPFPAAGQHSPSCRKGSGGRWRLPGNVVRRTDHRDDDHDRDLAAD